MLCCIPARPYTPLMRSKYFPILLLAVLVWANSSPAQQMLVTPHKTNGVYTVGESVHWQVEWKGQGPAPKAHYSLKRGGLTDVGEGDLNFTNNLARLETRF